MSLAHLRRSTFGLVASGAALLALSTIVIGAVAYEITHEALEKQLDHRIAAETDAILAESGGTVPGLITAIARRSNARSTSSLDYVLWTADEQPAAGTFEAQRTAPGYEEFLRYRRAGQSGVAQALTTQLNNGALVVAADRGDLEEIDRTLALLFAGAFAAILLLGVTTAGAIAWITRRRLDLIDGAARAIIAGDLGHRIPRDGSGSEFDGLAATLNDMLDRIAGLIETLTQVSSDIAHDLRTPLTRLHNQLELALAEPEPQARTGAIEQARDEAVELLEMFTALLRIAEVEALADRLPATVIDVSALIDQMGETYAPDFDARSSRLEWQRAPDLKVGGDRRLLSQALANLLDNALRHTPAGTRVLLDARRRTDTVLISVQDDGPGTSETDAGRLFRRFARGDAARSTPGHGLGLALVAAIAKSMKGTAMAAAQPGFTVVIEIPVADQPNV